MADNSQGESSDKEHFLPGYKDVASFTQFCFGKFVKATQMAHRLPSPGNDYEFYNSFPEFREFCSMEGEKVLKNAGKMLKYQGINRAWTSANGMDLDDIFESVVDSNDIMLERIDLFVDEANGLSKNKRPVLPKFMEPGLPVVSSWNKANLQDQNAKVRFLYAKNILRPQLKFKEKVDNSNFPFVPIIKEKPNSLRTLEYQKDDLQSNQTDITDALDNFIHKQRFGMSITLNEHPYKFELEQFEPDVDDMKSVEVIMYKPLKDTELIFVNTIETLKMLVETLKSVSMFAVDMEAHSFRSFQGITCLMQISTNEKDYLVDTLELRSELYCLNVVFTNPQILKVMHGADMDIGWLQRDFGIYVVNMFDTGQATRVLEYPRFSLAYLLKKFCDVTANKQFQLADWRIRPLPTELELYAREDTHYLLYIYQQLRNELVAKGNINNNLLESVYKRSKLICLKVYEKPIFTNKSYLGLYHKHKKAFNSNQLEAFRLLYAWRDSVARVEDESCAYVLPNHMLFGLAETLPKEPQGIIACCNPVPSLVRQNINELHRLISQARESKPSLEPPVHENLRSFAYDEASSNFTQVNEDSLLVKERVQVQDQNIKQDPSVPFKKYPITGPSIDLSQPMITLFIANETEEYSQGEIMAKKIKDSFQNPFLKFLPSKKLNEIPRGNNSEVTSVIDAKIGDSDEDIVEISHRYTDKKERYTKMTEVRGHSKKNKKRKSENLEEHNPTLRVKKQKKKSKKKSKRNNNTELPEEDASSNIQPFDYKNAQIDFANNEGNVQSLNEKIFNPYQKLGEKGKKFASKVFMKSGERSMTFSKKK